MNPADWRQTRSLFEAVVDLSTVERERALAEAPTGIRDGVRRLLAAHREPEPFGPTAGQALGWDSVKLPMAGAKLAEYLLEEEIGRGGTSIVFRASRAGQRYALKVLRPSVEDSWRRRFDREQKIVQAVQHPGVVRVHETGVSAEGWPFIAMDLVDGESIDRWSQGKDPRQIAKVIAQAAAALAYLHHNQFVHRDVKPANILVTREGQAVLIDFGIARADWPDSTTTTTLRPLTPAFASPEQLEGESAGPASDIYSLGATLLACTPAPDAALQSIARCMMEPLPRDRYPLDAAGQDFERYTQGQAIRALRVLQRRQWRRWWRAHRAAAIASAVAFSFASAGAFWYREALRRETGIAAQQVREQARLLIELDDTALDFPGASHMRRELVERSAKLIAPASAPLPEDAALDQTEALLRLGDLEGNPHEFGLGRVSVADERYRTAERIAATLPDSTRRRRLQALTLRKRAELRGHPQGMLDLPESIRLFERADPELSALRGTESAQADLAERYGFALQMQGRNADAVAQYARAVKLRRALAAARPADWANRRDLGLALQRLGETSPAEASSLQAESRRVLQAVLAEKPLSIRANRAEIRARFMEAERRLLAGHPSEARLLLQRNVEVASELLRGDPEVAAVRFDLNRVLYRLAQVEYESGKPDLANSLRLQADRAIRTAPHLMAPAVLKPKPATCPPPLDTPGEPIGPGPRLLVIDEEAGLLTVSPSTGEQDSVLAGGYLKALGQGVAASRDRLWIVSRTGDGMLLQLDYLPDRRAWRQSPIACGGFLRQPVALALAPGGALYVGNIDGFNDVQASVVRIDPANGRQSVVTQNGFLSQASGLAMLPSGKWAVANMWSTEGGPAEIVLVDPTDGQQSVLARYGELNDPVSLALLDDRTLVVAELNAMGAREDGALILVNARTGAQRVLAKGGLLRQPEDVIDLTGEELVVADSGRLGRPPRLIMVRKDSGAQRLLTSGGLLKFPRRAISIP